MLQALLWRVLPDGVRLNFAAQGGLSGGVFLVVRHGSHLPVGVQHQLDKGAFIGNVLPRCHVHDAVQREQRADIVLAGGFDPAVLAGQLAVIDAANLRIIEDFLSIPQRRGQHQRVSFGAEGRVGVVAGVVLHGVCQRLEQGQQGVALLVFRRSYVNKCVGRAQGVQLAAERIEVVAAGAVFLAHGQHCDLVAGTGGVGDDGCDGIAGRRSVGLLVVGRLRRVGCDGKIAVQRDSGDVDTFHRMRPFLPCAATLFCIIANLGGGFNEKRGAPSRCAPSLLGYLPNAARYAAFCASICFWNAATAAA